MKYKMSWQLGVMDNFSIEYYKNTADKYSGRLCHPKPDICNAPKDKRHCCTKEHSKYGPRGGSLARDKNCKRCIAGDSSFLKPQQTPPKPQQTPPKSKQEPPKSKQDSSKPKMNKETIINKLKNL